MPLFQVRRLVPEATRNDIDASAFRALACAFEFPGLRWVRSYWDQDLGELRCFYEASSAAQIEEHSRRSRIPCDEVREVIEVAPDHYVQPTAAPPTADRS